jgi:NADH-quinone oxidoreductase subunit G
LESDTPALLINTSTLPHSCKTSFKRSIHADKSFKSISFDDLPNKFLNDGTEDRGYILDTKDTETNTSIEDVAELEEMNGGVVYACSCVGKFLGEGKNYNIKYKNGEILGSKAFVQAAKISNAKNILIELEDTTYSGGFKIDEKLKGTVAIVSDLKPEGGKYKFQRAKITVQGS